MSLCLDKPSYKKKCVLTFLPRPKKTYTFRFLWSFETPTGVSYWVNRNEIDWYILPGSQKTPKSSRKVKLWVLSSGVIKLLTFLERNGCLKGKEMLTFIIKMARAFSCYSGRTKSAFVDRIRQDTSLINLGNLSWFWVHVRLELTNYFVELIYQPHTFSPILQWNQKLCTVTLLRISL